MPTSIVRDLPRRLRRVRALATGTALALTPALLAAQNTITLEGRVVGDSGAAPIADAVVTVRNIETNETRNASTRANGEFRILGLFSGRYEVSARAIGYKPSSDVVQLVIGQRASLTITLERGAAEISGVSVTAERVKSVEVQRMSVSAPVLKQEIENLPLNARGVMNLAAVAPGVKSYAPQQGRSLPSAGAAPDLRFINLYMDGVEMKSLFNGNLVGIPQTGSPLPQEALEEFRVYTTPYDAEYSRAGSYVISAVSRRGTNRWEGSAFGFFQNKDFIGKTFVQRDLGQTLPDYGRAQAGFNLRGPLQKDKLFLATSYELTNTNNYIDVNPGNRTQWAQYAGSFKAPNTNHTGFARITWVPSARSTVDGMFSTRYMTGESNFGNTVARNGGISQKYFINTGQLRHRWLSTGSFVNEASLQLVSWYHSEPPLEDRSQFNYPTITLGTAGFPLQLRETHYRAIDRATWTKDDFFGSHLVKFGAEASYVQGSQFQPNNQYGTFTFGTDVAANPSSASINVGFNDPNGTSDAKAELSGKIFGVYVNDEWRPVPNLALNLGLRYDVELDILNNDFTVPWVNDTRLTSIPLLDRWLNRGNRKNDLNNLSPRVSFSWDPTKQNRTFIRGGYGIIFDRVTSFIGFQERLSSTWRAYSFVNPGTTDPAVLRQRVVAGGVSATPAPILVKDKMNTPENRQMSLGIGHQFTDAFGVNVDYVRQRIRNLYVRWNPNYFDTGLGRRVLTSAYGDITLWDDFGEAKFDGLVSQFTYNRGETRVNLAYTLGWYKSQFDGNLSAIFPINTTAGAQNCAQPTTPSFECTFAMQRTSGDERHRFVLSEVSRIPFGFMLSSIITVASPRPFTVTDGRDLNKDNNFADEFPNGERTQRPDDGWKDWYRTVDVRLSRDLITVGTRRISAVAEVFNLFNADNRQSYGSRQFNAAGVPITNFGVPTAAFAARQAQVGVKVSF